MGTNLIRGSHSLWSWQSWGCCQGLVLELRHAVPTLRMHTFPSHLQRILVIWWENLFYFVCYCFLIFLFLSPRPHSSTRVFVDKYLSCNFFDPSLFCWNWNACDITMRSLYFLLRERVKAHRRESDWKRREGKGKIKWVLTLKQWRHSQLLRLL